jgi:NADPH:quinone reductase-like Zn-dependent oxidoreductase
VDVAIDSIGGPITGEALASLGQGGTLVTLGYPAGTQASINVTDLIWKATRVVGFNLFVQPLETVAAAYATILSLLAEGRVKPLVARTFPLDEAAAAQRYLSQERPFGKVVLTF